MDDETVGTPRYTCSPLQKLGITLHETSDTSARPYEAPALALLGSVDELTLGGSGNKCEPGPLLKQGGSDVSC